MSGFSRILSSFWQGFLYQRILLSCRLLFLFALHRNCLPFSVYDHEASLDFPTDLAIGSKSANYFRMKYNMRCLIWAPRRQNYKIFSHYNKYFYWLPFIDQSESGLHFLKLMPPLSQHFEVLNKMADEIVGKRILCEGFRGEIKYVGLVPPTSGTYVKNISSDIKHLEWCGTKTIDDFFIARILAKSLNLQLYSGIQTQILLVWSICYIRNNVMLVKRHITPSKPHFYGKKMGKKAFLGS